MNFFSQWDLYSQCMRDGGLHVQNMMLRYRNGFETMLLVFQKALFESIGLETTSLTPNFAVIDLEDLELAVIQDSSG